MKRTTCMSVAILLLLGFSGANAQSLGDYARAARKNKPENQASRHYDNDNLPTGDGLSVVGPPPSSDANAKTGAVASATTPSAPPSADDRQKAADEWKKKLDAQRQKIDALNHELDIDQRELRLRAIAARTDPTVGVRNIQWDKDEARYKTEMDEKQKALDAARQQLDEMQEQAHKAGIAEDEKATSNNTNKDK